MFSSCTGYHDKNQAVELNNTLVDLVKEDLDSNKLRDETKKIYEEFAESIDKITDSDRSLLLVSKGLTEDALLRLGYKSIQIKTILRRTKTYGSLTNIMRYPRFRTIRLTKLQCGFFNGISVAEKVDANIRSRFK
jgi:ubiquitin C-terminal hydrolase